MSFVPTPSPTVVDQTTLMKKYLQFVAALTDNNTPDETKLKMMQEVSENFENVTSSPQYSTFLEHIIPRFLTFLQDGEVQFLQEKPTQQLRKLVLEIIHRIPTNEHLRTHAKNILSVMFRFLEIESEENVLICLRIIIELHKQFRPLISQEIHHFLDFVKQIYKELPKVVTRYFENPQVIAENTVPSPEMVGMITSVLVKTAPEREDSETRTHTIIPRGSLSLKVLAELPIIVVLMYQLYKLSIHNVVSDFVPLIMNTIMLQVSPQARQHKLFNKELYADFIAAQIKTLSFLAYIIRIYQDLVGKHSQQMVKGMLQLLSNCPPETAHLRKELLIAAKHILTTDLRSQFVPCMDKLFDESILIGSGYTARETLRPLAYSTLADLVHHVRQNLPLTDLSLAVQLFAKNIDDESLPSSIQTMSCKLLLNLVDCIRSKSEQENGNGRDILMRMLEVFVLKFHTIARYQLVSIFKKCKPQSEMGVVDWALPGVPATPTVTTPALPPPAPPTPVTPAPPPATPFDRPGDKEDKQTFQVSDCRSLVKTLVCGVKTITWGITSCKAPGEAQFIPNKQLQPKETQIYIKLVKYAMQALDIYQVQIAGNGQTYVRVANCQTVKSVAIETALDCLKSANTEPYYRRQAWEVIKCFLVAMTSLEDNKHALYQLLAHPNFTEKWIPNVIISHRYKAQDTPARRTFEQALTGAFMSAVIKDLRPSALPFVASLIRHYTMVAVAQQCGPFLLPCYQSGSQASTAMFHSEENGSKGMDPLVLIDAIAICMAYEEKELCKIGEVALAVIFDVASIILGSKERACQLPLFSYIVERLCACCYEQAWYAKLGGVVSIKFLMERLPLIWVLQNQLTFLKALLFVMMDLTGEVSNGAVAMAKTTLEQLLIRCVLQDMVPPKKHLLRHQPANAQIGLMEGNTFCTTLQPRLFTMDLNVVEHKVFYTELLNLCEAEDAALMKLPCYKSLLSLVPLRIAALNALAACNYLPQSREKIIAALFKALNSTNSELQEAGEACMRKFLEGATIEVDQIHTHMRPLLMMLGDYRSLTLNVVNRLTSVTRLFPNSFNDKFCDQMMQHLRKWMEVVVITHKGGQRSDGSEMRICSAIINLFHLIPAAPQTLVKPLLEVVMKTERAMLIEAGSPFREPLIKFLTRHPSQTVELFMMEATLNDPQWSRMFMSFLKHKDAKPLRDVLASNPNRFVPLLVPAGPAATVRPGSPSTSTARLDLQFQAIKIISIIVKNDEGWLAGQHSLVSQLRRVWVSEAFQERHRKDSMAATNWKEPKLLAFCLLSYCKRNYSEIELLFQLLRAFTGRFLCNMTFLKEYMEEEIPKNYSITHKRALFFRFVEFNDPHFNDELKAKVRIYHLYTCEGIYSGQALHGVQGPTGKRVSQEDIQGCFLFPLRFIHVKELQVGEGDQMTQVALKKTTMIGHLLLAHIIAKFAIHKKIVLQVFHSLLKAHTMEARTSSVASKYEELECLYAAVGKVIYEGLTNYEKASSANPTQLFGTLMILKSACSNNSSYIDRLISVFMRSLQKMVREHLSPQPNPGVAETSTVTSELVMLSLDLVKERLSVMNMEMRKNFIQVILTSLIEKSPDPKILRAVVKIVEEWVKNNSGNPMATNQVPNPREKSILLVKMMTYIEKRFPDDLELNAQFLDLVKYVYRDENLSGSDITSKLEPAFLSGLRCTQPLIRAKFFEVFDASMKRRVYERLLYICCSQNWEAMGSHFWIKQCIELLLAVCERNTTIGTSCQGSMLPSITNVINLADSHDRAAFAMATHIKQEPRERENSETKEEDVEIDIELAPGDQTSLPKTKEQAERDAGNQLHMLTNRHDKFLDSLREVKTGALLNALVQLCHISTPLAEKTWVQLFPRLWKILSDRQQHAISGEMGPFLCSGSHQAQRDCQPSALNCFVEAMSQCVSPIPIRPCVLKYLGKTHNLWLRSTLMLEQQAFEKGLSLHIKPKQSTEFYEQESITPPQQEILDSLAELYSLLQEEDMWAGLWQKRCKFPETSTAIAYEQHGFFEQAQETYEKAMEKARKEHNVSPAIFPEYQLWEDHWIHCSKELNQWEPLTEYGQSKGHNNPYLVLECAWRVSNWAAMKEALVQVELSCPKEMAWKVNMHRGYLAICHPEEQQLNFIERLVEMASSLAIREWRRLPHIVSHVHTPLLQAAQQIIELQEAAQINAGLQPANLGRNTSLHDMKTVVKTWRNRLPIVSDDLSHWSSIFMWRQHHYQAIVTAYETNTQHDPNTNNAMLGVHASASAIIQYGKIARKQGLVNVALDILSRIHTIPTVPIVDCFQKIRQQVKCYLQLAGVMGKNECMQGLEVIESTNLKYFTKEMTAEFYALKGMFLAQINKSEEANKAFSAAVQMHDVLVKAWAMWGDYLENIFVKDRQPHLGVSAITCYLHACRHQNESKSRKYLAKVLWLLSFDDKNTLADAVDKYCIGVPPIQWLAWIPQLLTCLVGSEGKPLLNLISQVGRVYPQAVYFPIRTLYLTLKIEQRERYKSDSGQQQPSSAAAQTHSASDPGPIRATAPMWRCSRIMHMQRELHPTLLSSLEGIVDQMVWFRENWHEEVLRQLQQGLAKCYSVAFEKSGAVSDAKITPHTLNFVKKLVSTFGVGLENVSNVSTMFSSAASESLARRAQATAQDPVFQKMKGQFTTDFDFSVPGSMKLHNLISKLKKWIKILEAKTKQLPKFFLIEEKCRFLSNFSAQTAEVEIPGEFLMPKPTHYYIKIARFMPRVEIVQKHNTAARRLYIRGHNGKIYPYLVMNDACLTESRREERVLQLLRLLNPCLEKRKETTKRHLFFTVPRVVAVSPQMRLVEDNPSSLSLVEIYKQRCAKKGIEHDNPISRYYDRLATVQARGTQASHQVLRDILKEVQGNMVPRSMLKEWALHTFPNATDYWTFRKMFTIQLALIGLAEFMLHLNRLNPEMLQIAQDTGKLNVSYFRFDINDATGDLDANRPVPFRLTPNISEFLSTIGVSGPLTASMIAVARCFAQPNFKVDGILKAVLRDEIIAWHKKTQEDTSMPLSPAGQPENMDSQQLVSLVQKAVTAIMTRLHNLAQFEGGESKVNTLVAAANSLDNLCRMDPAWHPWL
uniref:Transformation/transcription domain-associated protein-like n=1 Tax=Sinocyclocheilus grahami TaxID=75366 RepID=A0A672Q252_SINGR